MGKTINAMTIEGGAPELQEKTATANGAYLPDTGYDGLSKVTVNVQPDLQSKSVTPTEEAQTVTPDGGYDGMSAVSVAAIDSEYVGSEVQRKSASDITASGKTVSVPAGYYETDASKSVQDGTQGTPTATKGAVTNHTMPVTPRCTDTTGFINGTTKIGTPVTVTASELVSGTKSVDQNGTYDVTEFENVEVNVSGAGTLQTKTATPTESEQVIEPDEGYDALESVTVEAIEGDYVGSQVTRRTSSDLTKSGATITAPAGYYASSASRSVTTATLATPTAAKSISGSVATITPSITQDSGYVTGSTKSGTPVTVSASELVSGTKSITANGDYDVATFASAHVEVGGGIELQAKTATENGLVTPDAGYDGLSSVDVNVQPNLQTKSVTPTESAQTVTPGTGYDGLSSVSVGAIDSEYVGSDITRRSSTDLSVSGATVTAPAGYYASGASKAVASGTQGTPTATKGTVTNHAVTVTPKCTDTTGYITGTTKTGTGVTVSASELVSGTKSITENGTADVTNFASVSVNVPGAELQSKTATPTESTQTITPDAGYDGLSSVEVGAISSSYVGSGISRRTSSNLTESGATVTAPAGYYENQATKTIASGTQGTPTASKGTVSNHSVSITPSCTDTTGYITGTTKTGTPVTVTASELVSGSETKTANGTYDVTNLAQVVVNVSGGGGEECDLYAGKEAPSGAVNGDLWLDTSDEPTGKAVQISNESNRRSGTTYDTISGVTLTVEKAGTYDVYWTEFRSSTAGTFGTQLYKNGTSSGAAWQTWYNNTHEQHPHLSSVSLSVGDVLTIKGRSGSTNNYIYASNLIIIEAGD